MRELTREEIRRYQANVSSILRPKTKHYRAIRWFSRIVLTTVLIAGWILLRRNHVTTIH